MKLISAYILLVGAFASHTICANQAKKEILEPILVGRPPSDAYIGLSKLEDGEIRHYDYGQQADPEDLNRGGRSGKASGYIVSKDHGRTWENRSVDEAFVGADIRCPKTHEYVRLFGQSDGVYAVRSKGGLDGSWGIEKITPERFIMMKPPLPIVDGNRLIVGAHKPVADEQGSMGTFYSDDGGVTWNLSSLVRVSDSVANERDAYRRWQNPGVEPTIVELNDGRLWMIARTSHDRHYESFSYDGGENWSEPKPSRFFGTLTMPTLKRLKDGRILFLWNNTTPMPELPGDYPMKFGLNASPWLKEKPRPGGLVFTNRDVLHAAISEDDGKTWIGFRELWLNEIRNKDNYHILGGKDLSVHQTQVVETDEGNLLVSLGQHPAVRSLVLFNAAWLYETERFSDFSNGFDDWTVHQYIEKVVGHARYNRIVGPKLIPHPGNKDRRVMKIGRKDDPTLHVENEGAVWNFPTGGNGSFETRMLIQNGSKGGRISLSDRWFNPCDLSAKDFAMFNLEFSGDGMIDSNVQLQPGKWYTISFTWDRLIFSQFDTCRVTIQPGNQQFSIPLKRQSLNGISYVHFVSTANTPDANGFLIEQVRAKIGR